jgi:uncharacterized protein YkwD
MQNFLSTIMISALGLFGSLYSNFVVQYSEPVQNIYEKMYSKIIHLDSVIATIGNRLNTFDQSKPVESSQPLQPEPVNETPVQTSTIDRKKINSDNIIHFTNQERKKGGLTSLKHNEKLSKSAREKSKDMIRYNYFAHESPEPLRYNFSYFIDQQEYKYIRISENLATGEFTTAQEVVTAWMNSPSHRANILYTNYRDIGISVSLKKNDRGGTDDLVIVQHFGTPKTNCIDIPQELTLQMDSISNDAKSAKEQAGNLKTEIDNQMSSMDDQKLYTLIETYNTTIRSYNELAEKFQSISDRYNDEVKKYNSCITK